jgi:hypothetical protein
VLAGASLSGISAASGSRFITGLASGFAGVSCVMVAAGVTLRLLTSETFYLGQLDEDADLKASLDKHAADILPPEFETIEEFLANRRAAIRAIQATKGNSESTEYKEASGFFASLEPATARIANLAHFESLRRNFKRKEPLLFLLSAAALICLGIFAISSGRNDAGQAALAQPVAIEVSPGKSWAEFAKAFSDACGDAGPLKAQLVGTPQPGWVALRLLAPAGCSGMLLSVPARLAAIPAQTAAPARSP